MSTGTSPTSGDLPAPCHACGAAHGIRDSVGWVCATCGWRVGDIVDSGLPPVRVDVVYYLRFRDRIKIGTSGNPKSRLAQLRFDELLAFERGDRELERRRHAQFAESRYPGSEWFHVTEALTGHIRTLVSEQDPWDLYKRWRSELLALRDA